MPVELRGVEGIRQPAAGAPGAFVLPVLRMEELGDAIRRKLVLEIAGARRIPASLGFGAPRIDCLIGERSPTWLQPNAR